MALDIIRDRGTFLLPNIMSLCYLWNEDEAGGHGRVSSWKKCIKCIWMGGKTLLTQHSVLKSLVTCASVEQCCHHQKLFVLLSSESDWKDNDYTWDLSPDWMSKRFNFKATVIRLAEWAPTGSRRQRFFFYWINDPFGRDFFWLYSQPHPHPTSHFFSSFFQNENKRGFWCWV